MWRLSASHSVGRFQDTSTCPFHLRFTRLAVDGVRKDSVIASGPWGSLPQMRTSAFYCARVGPCGWAHGGADYRGKACAVLRAGAATGARAAAGRAVRDAATRSRPRLSWHRTRRSSLARRSRRPSSPRRARAPRLARGTGGGGRCPVLGEAGAGRAVPRASPCARSPRKNPRDAPGPGTGAPWGAAAHIPPGWCATWTRQSTAPKTGVRTAGRPSPGRCRGAWAGACKE